MPLDATPPAPPVCRCDSCAREYTLAALRALRGAPPPAPCVDARRCECGGVAAICVDPAEDTLWAPCPCCDGSGDSTIAARTGTHHCGRCAGRGMVARAPYGECACGRTAPTRHMRRVGSRETRCVPGGAPVAWQLYECGACTASIASHVAQWGAA